jgi:NAD+ synthase (glutamine-hydrolysing)
LGLKDYVTKNGFSSVYIGISGGIDSAICAKIAVDAVGKDRVFGVMMPFTYTSQESLDDAKSLAKNLGINYNKITINSIFTSIWNLLYREIKLSNQASVELAKQNLQARIRGMLLSTLSNLTPASMILNTSNKSEIAVGYSTIYGDMVGGFSPIKDVKKTLVYKLCEYINTHEEIIPNSIIVKEPSAELADNQKDSDNLPDYEILDRVLENIISNKTSSTEKEILVKVEKLVRNSEWKRFQSPPGTRITDISLTNLDWRLPITNRFGKDI